MNQSLHDFLSIRNYQEEPSNHSIQLDFFQDALKNFKEVLRISVQDVLQVLRISENVLKEFLRYS